LNDGGAWVGERVGLLVGGALVGDEPTDGDTAGREGDGVGEADGVGAGLGVGDADADAEGDGVGEMVGDGLAVAPQAPATSAMAGTASANTTLRARPDMATPVRPGFRTGEG
jgi:hypothetical protein